MRCWRRARSAAGSGAQGAAVQRATLRRGRSSADLGGSAGEEAEAEEASQQAAQSLPASPQGAGPAEPWSQQERAAYFALHRLAVLPGDEEVLRFLEDVVAGSPLPAPWVLSRNSGGQACFLDKEAGVATFDHPMEATIRELAGVCRMCSSLPPALRESCVATLAKRWEEDAASEYMQWIAGNDGDGTPYYWNQDTGAATWSHPAAVVLPAQYLRRRAAEWLRQASWEGGGGGEAPKLDRRQVLDRLARMELRRFEVEEEAALAAAQAAREELGQEEGARAQAHSQEERLAAALAEHARPGAELPQARAEASAEGEEEDLDEERSGRGLHEELLQAEAAHAALGGRAARAGAALKHAELEVDCFEETAAFQLWARQARLESAYAEELGAASRREGQLQEAAASAEALGRAEEEAARARAALALQDSSRSEAARELSRLEVAQAAAQRALQLELAEARAAHSSAEGRAAHAEASLAEAALAEEREVAERARAEGSAELRRRECELLAAELEEETTSTAAGLYAELLLVRTDRDLAAALAAEVEAELGRAQRDAELAERKSSELLARRSRDLEDLRSGAKEAEASRRALEARVAALQEELLAGRSGPGRAPSAEEEHQRQRKWESLLVAINGSGAPVRGGGARTQPLRGAAGGDLLGWSVGSGSGKAASSPRRTGPRRDWDGRHQLVYSSLNDRMQKNVRSYFDRPREVESYGLRREEPLRTTWRLGTPTGSSLGPGPPTGPPSPGGGGGAAHAARGSRSKLASRPVSVSAVRARSQS